MITTSPSSPAEPQRGELKSLLKAICFSGLHLPPLGTSPSTYTFDHHHHHHHHYYHHHYHCHQFSLIPTPHCHNYPSKLVQQLNTTQTNKQTKNVVVENKGSNATIVFNVPMGTKGKTTRNYFHMAAFNTHPRS